MVPVLYYIFEFISILVTSTPVYILLLGYFLYDIALHKDDPQHLQKSKKTFVTFLAITIILYFIVRYQLFNHIIMFLETHR